MTRPIGTCSICGHERPLSWEHIPPKKAFNDQGVFEAAIPALFAREFDDPRPLEGRVVDAGAGMYSLCEKCNNDTGGWYGSAYVDWARQAMRLVQASGGHYRSHILTPFTRCAASSRSR